MKFLLLLLISMIVSTSCLKQYPTSVEPENNTKLANMCLQYYATEYLKASQCTLLKTSLYEIKATGLLGNTIFVSLIEHPDAKMLYQSEEDGLKKMSKFVKFLKQRTANNLLNIDPLVSAMLEVLDIDSALMDLFLDLDTDGDCLISKKELLAVGKDDLSSHFLVGLLVASGTNFGSLTTEAGKMKDYVLFGASIGKLVRNLAQ